MGIGSFLGKELVTGVVIGAGVNGSAEAIHGLANHDFSVNRVVTAAAIGGGAGFSGEAAAKGISRSTRNSISGVDDDIAKLGTAKQPAKVEPLTGAPSDISKASADLNSALKAKHQADLDLQQSAGKVRNRSGDPQKQLDADNAGQALADELGVPVSRLPKDKAGLDALVANKKADWAKAKADNQRINDQNQKIKQHDDAAIDSKLDDLKARKKELESRTGITSKGGRTAGISLATIGTWLWPRGGDSGGGSDGSDGGSSGNDKDNGASKAVPVKMVWDGSQYMETPPKEPIAPDPAFEATGEGFLLAPKEGLSPQVRLWYVG